MPERERGIPEEALGWKAPASEKAPLPPPTSEELENVFENTENAIQSVERVNFRKAESEIDKLISTGTDEESLKADDLRRALKALASMQELGSREAIKRLAKNNDQLFKAGRDAAIELKLTEVIGPDVFFALVQANAAVENVQDSMRFEASKEKIAKTKVS